MLLQTLSTGQVITLAPPTYGSAASLVHIPNGTAPGTPVNADITFTGSNPATCAPILAAEALYQALQLLHAAKDIKIPMEQA